MTQEADVRADPESPARRPRIWAFASGKGGVGKSLLASSLALGLAARGRRTLLVDADFGGGNLHTLLGVGDPGAGLAQFLCAESRELDSWVSPTPVRGLGLVAGARPTLGIADLALSRQRRLLRAARALAADEVLLDLGGGSAAGVIELFLGADLPVLVATPEPTSLENAQLLLKTAFYRSLRGVARSPRVRAALRRVIERRARHPLGSPRELVEAVARRDASAARALARRASRLAPRLVVNQCTTLSHRRLGSELEKSCRELLGISARFVGAVQHDPSVLTAIGRRVPPLQAYPGSEFARDVTRLLSRLFDAPESRAESHPRPPRPPLPTSAERVRLEGEPGAYLRRCRERLNLGIDELSERTRIRVLESIEQQRFDALPPEPYARAYVLQYARLLGIYDAESVAARFIERFREARSGAASRGVPHRSGA